MAVRAEMTERLGQIDAPALLLAGEYDAISTPEEMQGIADALPAARMVVIPAAGHMAPL